MVRPGDNTSALETLRRPGFAPQLKPSIKFYKTPGASIVTVTELPSGRHQQLYDFEAQIAHDMDGKRTLDDLAKRARNYVPGVSRSAIEKFVMQCAAMGLLSNLHVQRMASGVAGSVPNQIGSGVDFGSFQEQLMKEVNGAPAPAPARAAAPAPSAQRVIHVELNVDDQVTEISISPFADDPIRTNPSMPAITRSTIPSMPIVTIPAMPVVNEDGQAITLERVAERPSPVAPPARTRERPVAPLRLAQEPPAAAVPAAAVPAAPVEPAPPPAAEPQPAPEPDPVPQQAAPAGEEWQSVRPPWYRERWFRILRFWATLAILVGVLAAVPWPLYVTEECTILPMGRVEVRSQIDGILAQILVDEGARVKAGQVLARLDDREAQAALRLARSDVERLSSNLLKMKRGSRKEEIAQAKAVVTSREHDLKFAKAEADRRQELFRQGVGSGEQRDQAQHDFELKHNALEQAKADLRLLKAGFRAEDVAVAETELRRAEGEVQYQEKKLTLLTIASPIDGVVMTPKFRERLNEKVGAGATICEVADNSKVRVEIFVPERELDVVAIGQPTVVKVQSYPLHPFKGQVTFIGSIVEEKDGNRFLRVGTEIANTEGLLREHMTGYGEINTGKSRVLKLLLRRVARWVRVRFLI